MSRCTGHCCRHFNLPFPLDEIQAAPQRWSDGAQIAEMLIPIPAPAEHIIVETADKDSYFGLGPVYQTFWYTCKNFDSESGNCKAYETRPKMCREYPYNKPCLFEGCTGPDARERFVKRTPCKGWAWRRKVVDLPATADDAEGIDV